MDDPERMMERFAREVIDGILSGAIRSREELQTVKLKMSHRYRLEAVPLNSAILAHVRPEEREVVEPFLVKKPVRTISGVAVVAVMTSPHPCPHGKCMFCPGGVENDSPQSYTGKEPAARRAARNEFDPWKQVSDRIKQLEEIGHRTDKIDLIIMGGTFTCRDPEYQEWFVRRCFDAMNGRDAPDIVTAQEWNTVSSHRCVGLTVETRPDSFGEEQIRRSMELGATRVELGVQLLNDDILASVNRGHGIKEIAECTELCRRHGLKVCYHIMPGLPGSDPVEDMRSFRMMFEDSRFRPDMLKFYTTLVIEGTGLYDMWKDGRYEPYDVDTAVELLSDMKAEVPEYVRIQRIQRDIPAPQIAAGILRSNIRQLVQQRLSNTARACRCIRCREVGHSGAVLDDPYKVGFRIVEYDASGGREHFISLVYGDSLIGYIRLRTDGSDMATIRELKVFGKIASIGERGKDWQHRGYGKELVAEAERLARSSGASRIRVTSGVGVREYYASLGFVLERPYMAKDLT
ncbi:MAG: tRNA uridine(34) 5-carboxymethylaminomethyl modification radical SAM/GNAT enzyme Elp3 [Candidatus Methanomethylophilaceae archaeon]|nr:tRNA uridine(34) 5-carboxymethylaminomethyl modification radical SAM/GNAT enzyme Elp3 [Candidatus Methanomethylophilaceae archaeon]MDY5872000.1 tRNA uridine(34) 5-carboxymethylaminomethyl modification radical SAM/GNAT enzyme Elp3 [Candidatus Methanomethylophilaceae archaeon]